MKIIQNDDLMSIEQLELEFGISKHMQARLRMKINQGKQDSIPYIKVKRVILYSRKAINEWLKKFAVNPLV